jgi:hypothetical protein
MSQQSGWLANSRRGHDATELQPFRTSADILYAPAGYSETRRSNGLSQSLSTGPIDTEKHSKERRYREIRR